MSEHIPMRRSRQALSEQETLDILARGTSGVLSLMAPDGCPYGVPLSYVYAEGVIYFHGARSGRKLDAIAHCDRASFCVVDQDEVVPEKYTTYFRSAMAFGRVRLVTDEAEKDRALQLLGARYYPGHEKERRAEIDQAAARVSVIALTVEHLSGKEAIELVRARSAQAE